MVLQWGWSLAFYIVVIVRHRLWNWPDDYRKNIRLVLLSHVNQVTFTTCFKYDCMSTSEKKRKRKHKLYTSLANKPYAKIDKSIYQRFFSPNGPSHCVDLFITYWRASERVWVDAQAHARVRTWYMHSHYENIDENSEKQMTWKKKNSNLVAEIPWIFHDLIRYCYQSMSHEAAINTKQVKKKWQHFDVFVFRLLMHWNEFD